MWEMIFTDPVAWGSLLGIGIVVAICIYYCYLFLYNTNHDL